MKKLLMDGWTDEYQSQELTLRTSCSGELQTLTTEAPYIRLGINIETYPGWLELPLTGTNFNGPNPVQATEVLLYYTVLVLSFKKKMYLLEELQ